MFRQAIRKRDSESDAKASFLTASESLFLRASRTRTAQPSGPAAFVVWLRSRRAAVSLRRNEQASTRSRRRSGVPFPAHFAAAKWRIKRIPYQSGSPQSAAPRVCEANWKRRLKPKSELARTLGFSLLFQPTAVTSPQPTSKPKRRFFVTFLTQESNVPSPAFPLTNNPPCFTI